MSASRSTRSRSFRPPSRDRKRALTERDAPASLAGFSERFMEDMHLPRAMRKTRERRHPAATASPASALASLSRGDPSPAPTPTVGWANEHGGSLASVKEFQRDSLEQLHSLAARTWRGISQVVQRRYGEWGRKFVTDVEALPLTLGEEFRHLEHLGVALKHLSRAARDATQDDIVGQCMSVLDLAVRVLRHYPSAQQARRVLERVVHVYGHAAKQQQRPGTS